MASCQLICRSFRSWKQKELTELYWKKIEELVGEENNNILKQGAGFTGTLDLYIKWLGDNKLKLLAPVLNKIGLQGMGLLNGIRDEGAKHLAEVLKVNTSLKEVHLRSSYKIGDKGAKHLA